MTASCPFFATTASATAVAEPEYTPYDAPEPLPGTYIADWVTLEDLTRDPFPTFARLREEHPVPYVPAAGRYFVTRYADVHTVDNDPETFTADERGSLMKKSQGHSMLRMDDPKHAVQRATYGGVLKPKAIKNTWRQVFEESYEKYAAVLREVGPGVEFVHHFAGPYAAENLRRIMGFENATDQDMIRWSQTMINGTGNYADDPAVWAEAKRSYDEVNVALDEMIAHYWEHPNETLISNIIHTCDGDEVTLSNIRANLKMSIGGGINEPRDAITTIMMGLFGEPEQRAAVLDGTRTWKDAFEEGVRWIAPIGMYPRQTTREVELGGTVLPAGAKVGVVALSANRDESVFANADRYDLSREKLPHLAFGGGVHFCAGAWVARSQVADVALPRLFADFPGMRLDPEQDAVESGWVFRGMTRMPLTWDA